MPISYARRAFESPHDCSIHLVEQGSNESAHGPWGQNIAAHILEQHYKSAPEHSSATRCPWSAPTTKADSVEGLQ